MLRENKITVDDVKAKTIKRFWSKIKFGEGDQCWEWTRALSWQGYGWYHEVPEKPTWKAHRYMYKAMVGDFDLKLKVLHECDNPKCVNPNHLWLGTTLDNIQDKINKGRQPYGSWHGQSKLTEEDIVEIRKKLALGIRQRLIAKEFNIAQSAISQINNRNTWGRVI